MKSIRLLVVAVGVACSLVAAWAPPAKSESPHDTLTAWSIPFDDVTPAWMAAAGNDVVFTNFDVVGYVSRLNPASGQVTRWQLPYTPTSPGGLAVRSPDQAAFVTGLYEGDIEQLDLATGRLRRWPMPAGEGINPAGPLSVTVARDGAVLFLAYDSSNVGTYVGRLDTATGNIQLWSIPIAEPFIWQLALGAGETVVGTYDGFGPRGLFRLDLATNTFTIWSTTPYEAGYALASDVAGRIYFRQNIGSDWGIATFEPATGQVTRWHTDPGIGDRMIVSQGTPLFGIDGALTAFKVSHPGSVMYLSPSEPVVVPPASFTVSSNDQMVIGETAVAAVQSKPIPRRHHAGYDTWPTEGAWDFAITVGASDVYFTGASEGHAAIGRVTRN